MASHQERGKEKVQEAERALKRVSAESETVGSSSLARIAEKSRAHFSADDANQSDSVELWGSRIGRGLGLVFFIALIIYLVITYLI